LSNALFNRIVTIDQNVQYDAACKSILSAKVFLAHILHDLIKQYSRLDIDTIIQCINNNIQIASMAVNPNERKFVHNIGSENTIINEGTVRFDIIFTATHPHHDKIYVNIEAQNHQSFAYAIEQRGFYYTSRMLSSQYGVEFSNSHYEHIKECYSIWICLNPPIYKRNTIVQYSPKRQMISGKYEDNHDYHIVNVIILNLGNPDEKGINPLLRLLGTLLSNKKSYLEKKEIIENEFLISLSPKEREVLEQMCNLSYGIKQEGIVEGKMQGIIEGKIDIIAKLIMKIYKTDLKDWLTKLNNNQLDKIENIILDQLSLEEFIHQIEM